MAASPEESQGQGSFLTEPFSPSIFLDLPPTPRPDGDGENLAPVDDLVLPFISRMLMEEDIEDKFFYQYPDHPELLQAQQTYADILSGAATTSAGSDSAATNTEGSCPSPSSTDAPEFANATWPYDPVELYQLLVSAPNTHTVSNGSDAAVQSSSVLGGAELPACSGAGTQDVTGSFLSGQNIVNMESLNLAFLRGMEEAKKFLPTNNGLLLKGLEDSTSREDLPVPSDTKICGRGRKNRRRIWDDIEEDAEMGRNSKLMVPEPEETGEMVDKMIFDGHKICEEKMKSMSISMGSEVGKNTRRSVQGRYDEAVDLRALLIQCAQAVSMDDRRSANQLLRQIKQHSSPKGDDNQRLAYCLAEGLEARLAGTGSKVYKSLVTKRTSVVEFLKAYQLYLSACCFEMTAIRLSNVTIWKAIGGRKKVHIVDYGIQYGLQWPSLLQFFSTWEGGPPEVRITGIDLPQPGFRPASRIEETGRRLSKFAHQFGVPFKFHSITAKWDAVSVDDLNIDPHEVLIVNGIVQFGNLMDEGVGIYSPSPRDVVLQNIRNMRPDVFILCVVNGSFGAPFFVTRFREALFHYSAMFDMLDATMPRDDEQRLFVERDIIGRCALNVISCEGLDRVERPESYKQWQVRNHQAGLRELPLRPDIVKILRDKVKKEYHKDFLIDVDHHWLLQGWKGRIIYAMSTWVADESV